MEVSLEDKHPGKKNDYGLMNERILFSDNIMPNLKMLLLPRNTTSQQKNTFHVVNMQVYRKEKKMLRGSQNIKSGNLTGNIMWLP